MMAEGGLLRHAYPFFNIETARSSSTAGPPHTQAGALSDHRVLSIFHQMHCESNSFPSVHLQLVPEATDEHSLFTQLKQSHFEGF